MAAAEVAAAATAPPDDLWPRTRRPGPWFVAALLFAICVLPIDAITFRIPLPFDPKLDRVLLAAGFAIWFLRWAVGRRHRGARYSSGTTEVLLFLFLGACVVSVWANFRVLDIAGDADQSVKQLIVILSFIAFYAFVAGNVKAEEVPRFLVLLVVLAAVAGLGTIIEYVTKFNLFYTGSGALFGPIADVTSNQGLRVPNGRPEVSGPARHGLAVAAMLAMALPFALVQVVRSTDRSTRTRIALALLAILLAGGALFTLRRSGVILPFVSSAVVILLGGRRMVPLAVGYAVVLLAAAAFLPSVVTQTVDQLSGTSQDTRNSDEGRSSDYAALAPDLRHGAITGRGLGVYNGGKYRILDNAYLGLAASIGFPGLALFMAFILSVLWRALRTYRRGPPWTRDLALACAAGAASFFVASALFDILAFPQAPYFFLSLAVFSGVLANVPRGSAAGDGSTPQPA